MSASPTPVRFIRRLPAALAILLAAASAHATVGTVEFASGDASVRAANGDRRSAVRGAVLNAGDTVETALGRLQLRMADGAFIALQPQSLLRIDEYVVAGQGAGEERGLLGLLRGGLRTITGSIGRVNRSAYRLTTPTATVGIRGTEFAASADGGTRVSVTEGAVALCNDGGCVDIAAGQTGFTPDRQARPTLVFQAPRTQNATGASPGAALVAERRNDSGQSSAIVTPAAPAAPVVIPLANGAGQFPIIVHTNGGGFAAGVIGGTQTFNAAGALTTYTDCCGPQGLSGGVSTDFGADGIIAWGRWSAGNSTFSGAVGAVTSALYIGSLSANAPAMPVVRAYAAFASTAPTIVNAAGTVVAVGASNTVTGSLSVNFPSVASGTVSYNLSIPVANQTFTVNGSAVQFSTTAFLGSSSTITSSGGLCGGGCVGTIPFGDAFSGVITGSGGSRAGGVYGFTSSAGKVSGAVVFR